MKLPMLSTLALAIVTLAGSAHAQVDTAITYQGQLKSSGEPFTGSADLRFSLFAASTGGSPLFPAVTTTDVTVINGIFSTPLDFGVDPYTADAQLWLQIEVRSPAGSGNFVLLNERQRLTPAPFSLSTRGLSVESSGDTFLQTEAAGNRVFGLPQGNQRGSNLIVQAGGTLVSDAFAQTGGNLILRAGNANLSAAGSPPIGTSGNNDVIIQGGENTAEFSFRQRFSGNIRFIAGDSSPNPTGNQPERMRILGDNGFVGIGTIAPATNLHVRAAATPAITVGTDTDTQGALFLGNPAHGLARNFAGLANDVGLYTTSGNLRFSTNNSSSTQMILTNAGNLGIAATAPTAKIDIAGRVQINDGGNGGTQGFIGLRRQDTGRLTAVLGNVGSGYVIGVVNNEESAIFGGVQTNYVTNQSNVFASTKNFVEPNPRDPATDIYYASLEGPEAAMYMRGTATLLNGQATITMPAHFSDLASAHGVTVIVTPLSADSLGLAVVGKGNGGFQVRELMRGTGNYQFDWEIKAVRKQHLDYKVIRPWTDLRVVNPNVSEAEMLQRRQRHVERSNARAAKLEALEDAKR